MKLERIQNVLFLKVAEENSIAFREEWVEQLRNLPPEGYGEFMRDTIYPALSAEDRKVWHKTAMSNLDIQSAVMAFDTLAGGSHSP